MNVLKTIVVTFSLFSHIPMPQLRWDERNMRYMLCAFPLVGLVSGLLLWAWLWLSQLLGFGNILFAAGITLLPLAVTGGIHLDGFCDTADALASHGGMEKRQEILKDPHLGAFGAIGLGAYLLLYFALATELPLQQKTIWLLGLSQILSRSLSGLAVLCFPARAGKGMASTFRSGAEKRGAALILLAVFMLAACLMIWFFWPVGCCMVFAALLCLLILRLVSNRCFGGISGDLAGWFLQLAELLMLAVLILMERVIALCF